MDKISVLLRPDDFGEDITVEVDGHFYVFGFWRRILAGVLLMLMGWAKFTTEFTFNLEQVEVENE